MKGVTAILIGALCSGVAIATEMYGSYGYGDYGYPPVEAPEKVYPSPPEYMPKPMPSPVVPKGCLPAGCEGDKLSCPIMEFASDEINDCCRDDYCGTCHSNGCNQCCPGAFKPSYEDPCIPCCEYDPYALMCTDFTGSQQCAEGYMIVKDDATGWQMCMKA